ncbi:MAG: tetratricopeptide repeat protein [Betaproteobacteria bacterium]|nr:tetratricopeptide repeat protein [Betaproteobacteria bacterium]
MAYDLEEQEQIAALKDWWRKWGNLVTTALLALLVGVAGTQAWRYYSATQAASAATLYGQLDAADKSGEAKRVHDIAATLVSSHAGTPYAAMAAMRAAQSFAVMNDLANAKLRLQWVLDKAGDENLRDLARLRLAGVLLDEKNFDEALKLLDAKRSPAYDGLYADLRGDVLSAQNKRAEARAAYLTALEKIDVRSEYRQLVQVKLDALGEATK